MKISSVVTQIRRHPGSAATWLAAAVILGSFAVLAWPTYSGQALADDLYTNLVFWPGIAASVLTLAYYLFLAILACRYQPTAAAADAELPTCTVIVPAYNEGEHVAETLRSLLDCDYPPEKMEIFAINDGSRDDTWNWILRAAAESDGRITPVNFEQNAGKKHALYQGMLSAGSDLVVTVDSDCIVEKSSLRNLVAPFRDPKVGGVAGSIRVKNLEQGWIPLMLDICFTFGFEFIRTGQSVIGSVLCTPGALSAYRRSAVLPLLSEWLHQNFLGAPSTIGEDRAITSLLLRSGYKVKFQSNAVVATCVPSTYVRLCRMLIRWTRSDIRENLVMTKFAFQRVDLADFDHCALQINMVAQNLNILLPCIFLPLGLFSLLLTPSALPFAIYTTAAASILWAVIPAMIYARRYSAMQAAWSFIYAGFNLVALSWICLYSVVTVRNSKWLTREVSASCFYHSPAPATPTAEPRRPR